MTARLTEATYALRALAPFCYNAFNLTNRRPFMKSEHHSRYEYNRTRRLLNRKQHNEYNHEWKRRNRERYLENKRAWNNGNRDSIRISRSKSSHKYKKANRLKENCRSTLRRAVASGVLVRPAYCSLCSKATKVSAHHRDYAKPLEVIWVCSPCHREIHHPVVRR